MKNILQLAIILLITACDQLSMSSKSSNPQALDHIQASQLQDYVTVQVQPTTKPERYMVYFGWPRIEDQKRIRIRKEQVLATVLPNQSTFSHEVDHNQTITYTFDITDSSARVEKSFSKLVVIPRDFVVRAGQSEFTENLKLNVSRLFLSPEISLRTNGFNIEIITDQIISDKGVIETFTEDSKAKPGENGRSAGDMVIRAKTASGNLKVYMRGEHGGDGLQGEAYSSRAADGAPPGDGESDCICRNDFISNLIPEKNTGICSCQCISTGHNGGNAQSGAKGHTGGTGGIGGSYGHLKVEIQDGSAFLLETYSRIGFGGAPGPGGPGQAGGIAQGTKTKCSGYPGANGQQGPPGDLGMKGEDGKPGLICIYIASEGKNDCY